MSHPRKCEMCARIFEYVYSRKLMASGKEWRCPTCREKLETDVVLPPPNPMHFVVGMLGLGRKLQPSDRVDHFHRPYLNTGRDKQRKRYRPKEAR